MIPQIVNQCQANYNHFTYYQIRIDSLFGEPRRSQHRRVFLQSLLFDASPSLCGGFDEHFELFELAHHIFPQIESLLCGL